MLTKGLWMGQTEVTVAAFQRFARATGGAMPAEPVYSERKLNAGWANGAMPIVNVNWNEAKSYCEWIGGRLPTEAEWEYAARAGSTASRYAEAEEVAWYADNSGKSKFDAAALLKGDPKNYVAKLASNENSFHGVGLKRPNSYGLYDMLGNVTEWTADWYGASYYQGGERRNPQGPPNGEYRITRGGSWDYFARILRVSDRGGGGPSGRGSDIGFRCAWD